MAIKIRIPVPLVVQCSVRLRDSNRLAAALRVLGGSGLLGILIDLDHIPRVLAIFLGRSTLPPGRPLHLASVVVMGYICVILDALFVGLLSRNMENADRDD